ncbi:MAG: hypothetical protein IH905_04380 [Proteobacteria bacterium]|nr:hypothetical protein [Pseudomonadota bacterium]
MPGRILRRAYAAVALAIIIFFVHQPAVLSDEGGGSSWIAVATSGEVFYRPGDGQPSASWRPLTRGTAIAVSGQVKTGPDGEVTLVRGKDTIEPVTTFTAVITAAVTTFAADVADVVGAVVGEQCVGR